MWHLRLVCNSPAITPDKNVLVKKLQSSTEVKRCSAMCTLSLSGYPFTFSAKAYHFKSSGNSMPASLPTHTVTRVHMHALNTHNMHTHTITDIFILHTGTKEADPDYLSEPQK